MAEPITIPIAIFEVTINYERPALPILSERLALIVQQLFEALMPWNPNMDDIEIRQTGNLSEQGISFKLPAKRASFILWHIILLFLAGFRELGDCTGDTGHYRGCAQGYRE